MLQVSDLVRLLAVFACSGIFWMMIWFLIEKISLQRPLPGPTGLAIILLVAAAYVVIAIVTRDAAAFGMP